MNRRYGIYYIRRDEQKESRFGVQINLSRVSYLLCKGRSRIYEDPWLERIVLAARKDNLDFPDTESKRFPKREDGELISHLYEADIEKLYDLWEQDIEALEQKVNKRQEKLASRVSAAKRNYSYKR